MNGLLGDLAIIPVRSLQLEADRCLPLVKFTAFPRIFLGRNFTFDAEIQKGLELPLDMRLLAAELLPVLPVLLAGGSGLGPDDLHDPLTDGRVFDLQAVKVLKGLGVHLALSDSCRRMPRPVVLSATVVGELLDRSVGEFLADLLSGHDMPAVVTPNQAAGEGDLGLAVDTPAELVLDGLEGRQIDDRLELPRIPDSGVPCLPDVVPVGEEVEKRGLGKSRPPVGVNHALPGQGVRERHQRVGLVGVQLKDPLDLGSVDGIVLDKAPAIDPHVAKSEMAAEGQSALDPPLQPCLYVGSLLVGLVAGEHRAHPALHAAGRSFSRRLVWEEEGNFGLFGKFFKVGPIPNVSGRPVHLHEEHAIERLGMLLDVSDELAERVPLLALARRFGDAVELDDGAAKAARELQEPSLLVFEAKALFLLFDRTHPGPRDELFHGVIPRQGRSTNVPCSSEW